MKDFHEYKILKNLIEACGDELIEELAYLIEDNGTGDCYNCICCDFNYGNKCHTAQKLAVKYIITGQKEGEKHE